MRSFYQDRLGTNIGKTQKRLPFSQVGYDLDHPLRLRSLQAMIYLSDVSEGTHCFSLSPESIDDPSEGFEQASAQLQRSPPIGAPTA